MKKSKIINLMLLTVSFTTAVKAINKASTSVSAVVSPALIETDNNALLLETNSLLPQDHSITRGGFGDDRHSGAEQSHDEKK